MMNAQQFNSAVSLDAQLSHLRDSAEMLNLILRQIVSTDTRSTQWSIWFTLLYPASRTYKPCDWMLASGARLIDGVAEGRLPPFFNKIYKKCSKCILLTTFICI